MRIQYEQHVRPTNIKQGVLIPDFGTFRLGVGDKCFIITETVNGIRLRVGDDDRREIEIRPQSKEEIYISLR